jgi:hypothetical protein
MLTPPSIPEYTVNDRSSYTFSSLSCFFTPQKIVCELFLVTQIYVRDGTRYQNHQK